VWSDTQSGSASVRQPTVQRPHAEDGGQEGLPVLKLARAIAVHVAAAFWAANSAAAVDLTALELRWLHGAAPVLAYAREQRLPLDVVVQPQPTPGASPLALGFVGGRCKLVLSMRGNPEAQAVLDRIEPAMMNATLELMAAHELGHCRRYLDGAWTTLPSRFVAEPPVDVPPEQREAYRQMRAVRREEGFGDLVGLAWVQAHHPQHYARLHAWLLAERSTSRRVGTHHDTLAWLRLAGSGFEVVRSSIFGAASTLWTEGLLADD